MEISSKEVLRHLGFHGAAANERTSAIVEELIAVFADNVTPKNMYGIWDCKIDSSVATIDSSIDDSSIKKSADSSIVVIGNITINSKNLAKHLTDCRRVVLLAATLGAEADTLIRRYSVQDMEKAVIAQAVCAAMIEAYCDEITCKIENEFAQNKELCGLHPVTRFSPGYGDFDIAHQKDILNFLNCRRIGLTLTDGNMLVPSKSVTAVVGFSQEKGQTKEKCANCAGALCEYREVV